MKINLLIVEDESAIREMIHFSLSEEEFTLIDADDIQNAKHLLANTIPDLILLDWMLPGGDGIELIKWIKKKEGLQDIPIIMLTAKAEEASKVKGLMLGADDYITKPFSPDELTARIKTVLRRGIVASPGDEIRRGDIAINKFKNQVTIKNNSVVMTPIEFKMLYFFLKHPNKTYTREQLLDHIWGGNQYINDRTVDVYVRRLRNKLKKFDCHELLKTIRSTGYQFSDDHE